MGFWSNLVNYQISYLVNPSTLVLVNFFGVVDFEWRQHVRHAWTDVAFFCQQRNQVFFKYNLRHVDEGWFGYIIGTPFWLPIWDPCMASLPKFTINLSHSCRNIPFPWTPLKVEVWVDFVGWVAHEWFSGFGRRFYDQFMWKIAIDWWTVILSHVACVFFWLFWKKGMK